MESEISKVVEYREIADFPGYQIGDDGTYRSQKHSPGRPRLSGDHWYVMRGHDNGNGYLAAHFQKDKRRHVRYVHRLVLETFVGPCPPGMEARHFPDNNRKNCRLDNLSWATRPVNHADKKIHGTMIRGESVFGSVLTEIDVIKIRILYKQGIAQKEIAKIFGVAQTTVSHIVLGQIWKHVP